MDVPNSKAQSISFNLHGGIFNNQKIGSLNVSVQGIDFKYGKLQKFSAHTKNSQFNFFPVDELKITTPAFKFNPIELSKNQRFIMPKPVRANITLKMSEGSLNKLVSHPTTVDKLESGVAKVTGNFRLIKFFEPKLQLSGGQNLELSLVVTFGDTFALPVKMNGQLVHKNQNVQIENMQMATGNNKLPKQLSKIIQDQLNKLFDLNQAGGNKDFSIKATSMRIVGKIVVVQGYASLSKLQFGKKK
ncbi:MAG: LmeA family phospholipid-binding protein [Vampirovibrio sp.]|nr:LmeA family phospholipid-binding protein [Vampirovibrio sp.]